MENEKIKDEFVDDEYIYEYKKMERKLLDIEVEIRDYYLSDMMSEKEISRATDYFYEHSDELKYLNEYQLKLSSDFLYLVNDNLKGTVLSTVYLKSSGKHVYLYFFRKC